MEILSLMRLVGNNNRDYLRSKSSKDVKGQSDPVASCNPLDFEYNMTHPRRGKAIIFNHSVCNYIP